MEEELFNALKEAQRRHIVLVPTVRTVHLWASGQRIPGWIRRIISKHRKVVLLMIQRSEVLVCPNLELHKRSWGWQLCWDCCDVCSRLVREVA